jgi:hypothetical protein
LFQALERDINDSYFPTVVLNLIGKIIKNADLFLMTNQINILFNKLLEFFNRVNISRNNFLSKNKKINDHNFAIEKISYIMGCLFKSHKELTLDVVGKLLNEYVPNYLENDSNNFEKKMGLLILVNLITNLGQIVLKKFWIKIGNFLPRFIDSEDPALINKCCFGIGEYIKQTENNFNLNFEATLKNLNTAMGYLILGQDEKECRNAKDAVISAIGKIIKHKLTYLEVNIWIPTWFSLLPLIWKSEVAKAQNELLCEILTSENSRFILGNNSENYPNIIKILAEVYDTQNANRISNKHILTVVENIKNNPSLHEYIRVAKENCIGKVLENLVVLFP